MGKQKIRIVHPSDAARSLEDYCTRVGAFMMLVPSIVNYIETTPTKNEGLRDKLLEIIRDHEASINEHRNEGNE